MWSTRDGYGVSLPRFRARRLIRRVRQRGPSRVLLRRLGWVGRSLRAATLLRRGAGSHRVFRSLLGRYPLLIFTRVVAPGKVELLFIRRTRGY